VKPAETVIVDQLGGTARFQALRRQRVKLLARLPVEPGDASFPRREWLVDHVTPMLWQIVATASSVSLAQDYLGQLAGNPT
jgi:hypothetical protein